ncbi:hypothetical protein EPA93_28835 [Ktedonosporobacter rubrisoli]|uniref:Glycoside hydrolase family 44 domain-containing protein n=1 Tax=Ktedonosporobacter rubrisoli TaxID=2509675 RepID=A0A4P6JVR8_KTERU|nr:hypothetical protein [Ktedonosporobacter rubrisoli]QBD79768.1 hypothetical protein EPA93_28835 [Ktedonosporobacter rubrisoli]
MVLNSNKGRDGTATQLEERQAEGAGTAKRRAILNLDWKDLNPENMPRRRRQRGIITILSVVLLIMVLFTALRLSVVASAVGDQLILRVGDQQAATVDLRQSFPINPDLFGANIFPRRGLTSQDGTSGFVDYTSSMLSVMRGMHIHLLRYPGGEWGEQHILSIDQLKDFSQLLDALQADGMLQAHLSGPVADANGALQPAGMTTDLHSRAVLAGRWVDYMNNPKSQQRIGAHQKDPFHRVALWTVGNEPNLSLNPLTGKPYTVAEYVSAFIQFSLEMHRSDPTIKVFGPELSQFYGLGAGPTDAQGALWMEGFLKGVSLYQQQHPELSFQLLNGVSFHRYQFDNPRQDPALLLSSSNEWNYLLPSLRALIRQDFGQDLPIAITEINANPGDKNPPPGQAALWWADTLGTLMNQQVEYTAFFSATGVDRPYPFFVQGGLTVTTMARVMQLFAHMQSELIPLAIQHDPISVYATQDKEHQTVSLLFVNKSPIAQNAQIEPLNRVLGFSPWHSQDISLAGNSLVMVTLHRNGGAEAYSFTPSNNANTAVAPLTYTECGNKTDPLAVSVPC